MSSPGAGPRSARYFFHLHKGDEVIHDEVGVDDGADEREREPNGTSYVPAASCHADACCAASSAPNRLALPSRGRAWIDRSGLRLEGFPVALRQDPPHVVVALNRLRG